MPKIHVIPSRTMRDADPRSIESKDSSECVSDDAGELAVLVPPTDEALLSPALRPPAIAAPVTEPVPTWPVLRRFLAENAVRRARTRTTVLTEIMRSTGATKIQIL